MYMFRVVSRTYEHNVTLLTEHWSVGLWNAEAVFFLWGWNWIIYILFGRKSCLNGLTPISSLLLEGTAVLSMRIGWIVKIWREQQSSSPLPLPLKRALSSLCRFYVFAFHFLYGVSSVSLAIQNIFQPNYRTNSSLSVDEPHNYCVGDVADHSRRYMSICLQVQSVIYITKQTPFPLVRKRTIPTERPPLVGEI
jgi:hypothetical protein